MALAAPADLQLTGKSTHPIKGSPGLLLSIADARLSRGARPRQGEGCWAVGAPGTQGGKKGGSGQVLAARAFMMGGHCGRSHPMCPGTTSPIGVVHTGDGPQGVPRAGARGCGGGAASLHTQGLGGEQRAHGWPLGAPAQLPLALFSTRSGADGSFQPRGLCGERSGDGDPAPAVS